MIKKTSSTVMSVVQHSFQRKGWSTSLLVMNQYSVKSVNQCIGIKKELQNHMKEQHHVVEDNQDDNCKCTSDSVCDQCIDYWVQKGNDGSQYKLYKIYINKGSVIGRLYCTFPKGDQVPSGRCGRHDGALEISRHS